MKKHLINRLILIFGLLIACLSYAQSSNENYVQSISCFDANCLKKAITVQYLNGFGKAKQIVEVKASPQGNDLVTHIEYDNFGRQTKNFLPVPQTGTLNGNIIPNPLDNGTNPNIYGNEKFFSENKIENSPLNRLQEQIKVGLDWANKPNKYEYLTNSDNDIRKYYTITNSVEGITYSTIKVADDSESQNGFYKESILYKKKTTNEDGNIIYEYTNDQNQLVLIRSVLSANEYADTYYVYNEYNNLAFVIPPKASDIIKDLPPGIQISDDILDNLCYQYRFDGKNRVAEKKLPNKGWEYYVYDKQDRLVLTQDAVLRTTNNNFKKRGWIFVKYDIYGRVVYTGFFNNTASRLSMQTALNNMTLNAGNNEERVRIPFNLNGMDIYYTKNAFPTSSMTVLSVNYYDSYPPQSPSTPTKILDQYTLQHSSTAYDDPTAVSLPTASFLKNIENDDWTKIFNYYDTKGRIIGTHSANHLGGYTKTESKLDFAGLPQTVITKHKRLEIDTERIITENFEYDHHNRLLVHKHQVDSNPVEILTQNKYNELSQLESKKIGGNSLGSSLQQVDYKYNIRGWMTQINDPANLGFDLFGYKINYNKVEGQEVPNNDYLDLKVKPKYNGNIAEVSWKTLTESDEPLKTYGYVYDSLNRLSAGFYQKSGNEFAKEYFEKLEYDLNGNITRLKRSAGVLMGSNTALAIDDLKYDYIGNRLIRVTDQQMNYSGYPYTANPGNIVYDNGNGSGNGNMTSHPDKGISSIQYNYLNLPKQIVQNAKVTDYIYRADGVKVKKLFGDLETDYLDGFQYKSTKPSEANPGGGFVIIDPNEVAEMKLRIIPTSEGYYDALIGQYVYNFTDHLGNVRLSYTDSNKDGVIQPRQYFQRQCDDISSDPWDIPNCIDIWKPGEIVEVNNYYPFGLLHDYTATSQNAYQYKYNGKELQETGMYDYGARMYMPDLGRWGVYDPLSELQFAYNPYSYVYGNPIRFNDPTGMIGEEDPPKKGSTPDNPIDIGEIKLTKNVSDSKLSFMGIQSLSAYHGSQNRLAFGIRNSKAALATEKFERNLAFTMGTFLMGGSNLVASAGWATLDAVVDYQDEETQDAVGTIQLMAMLIQVSHGNINGIQKFVNVDASRINIAKGITRFTPLRLSGEPVSAGWKHVLEGHFNRPLGNNRSVFSTTEEQLKNILQSKTVINSPLTPLTGGQFQRTVDTGQIIGNASLKQGGAATSWINVITDYKGNLITTYPIAP